MYNIGRHPVLNFKSNIYIASFDKDYTEYDDNGNELQKFDTPIKYRFNVQANNTQTYKDNSYIGEYGYNDNSTKVVMITEKKKYLNKFKEFDRVYLDTTPNGELENGDNADYRVSLVRNQNTCIKLYLTKLTKDVRS